MSSKVDTKAEIERVRAKLKKSSDVEIRGFLAASDASGVIGTARCGGYSFSCYWLGYETKVYALDTYGAAHQQRKAARAVERAFTARVMTETSEEYRKATAAMYADSR